MNIQITGHERELCYSIRNTRQMQPILNTMYERPLFGEDNFAALMQTTAFLDVPLFVEFIELQIVHLMFWIFIFFWYDFHISYQTIIENQKNITMKSL